MTVRPRPESSPALSVVLVTDRYETVRRVLARLREQTARDRVEVVIVGPSREALGPAPPELEGFAAVQVVEGSISPLAPARAAGVRAARAAIVFMGETHTYPHLEWAETLIRAHAGPWAAVVPGLGNANPDGPISWANLLFDYGPWLAGLPAGEVRAVPTYNTAYKRARLLEQGERLEGLLTNGDALILRLREDGGRFYFEPAARLDHANVSQPAHWLAERYHGGRLRAASRMENWPRLRRLAYVCASPLIPAVVLARLWKPAALLLRQGRLAQGVLPLLVVSAIVSAVGEVVGYAFGEGASAESRMAEYELHKVRYTTSRAT